jgi:hypothetical protein
MKKKLLVLLIAASSMLMPNMASAVATDGYWTACYGPDGSDGECYMVGSTIVYFYPAEN